MTTETTATPRAFAAVRTARIARTLATLAPEVTTVRLTPLWTDAGTGRMRRTTHVLLLDAHGRPVDAGPAAHRLALDTIRRHHTRADWTREHRYDLTRGQLIPMTTPFGPRELPPAAEPQPLPDRRDVLRTAIRRERGEWTAGRVLRTYRAAGLDVPKRATARDDLRHAAAAGLLTMHETPGRRYYTPRGTGR